MKSMVASRVETVRLTSKLLVLGLCLGFHPSFAGAQTEEAPPSGRDQTEPASPANNDTPKAEEGFGDKIKDKVEELKNSRQKNRKETTDAILKRRGKDPEVARYVTAGEAQTLPEKVIRFDFVYRNIAGNQTFEKGGGAKKDKGLDVVANVRAYSFAYGISDKLSVQLVVPTIASNQLTINADKFSTSKIYAKNYKKLMDAVIPALQANSATECFGKSYEECDALINEVHANPNNDFSLPTDTPMILTTGETYVNKAKVPVRTAGNSMITNAAKPKNGVTGVGDITLGALYNAFTATNQRASVGLGLRLPTGKGKDEKTYNRTGSGFTTAIVGVKYDYQVIDPFVVSLSNQFEFNLKNAHYLRHSILNPDELNTADVNTVNETVPSNKGDGVTNNYQVSKKGPTTSGTVRLAYSLGALSPYLGPLTTFGYYGWAFNPETYYDSQSQQNESRQTSITYALAFDGLALPTRIPAGLTLSQERIISGNDVTIATVSTTIDLNVYYKF